MKVREGICSKGVLCKCHKSLFGILKPFKTRPFFSENLQKIFIKFSENLNRLDKTFPKIYICWGIVGDTNITNFHQFLSIFTNFHGILLTGSTRRFRKYIYVGVKSRFQFCQFEPGKNGGGVAKCYLGKCPKVDQLW